MNICLVACAKTKLARPMQAKLLYTSPLFQKSRAYAEKYFDAWGILSAKHGLVLPDQVIAPYDVTFGDLTIKEASAWCQNTRSAIKRQWDRDAEYTMLAGAGYICATTGLRVSCPLEGLQVGQRLQWLNEALK